MSNTKTNVVFIGDSITDFGTYPSILETQLTLSNSLGNLAFYNAGLSSETLSGLSEPSHPGIRPCIFQRLDRIVEITNPHIAIVLYGVNDGIYHPFSDERFCAYKDGVKRIVKTLTEAGSKVAIMTPTPFDKPSSSGPFQNQNASDFSFEKVYENYDDVMEKYSDWVKKANLSDWTVDTRTAILTAIQEQRQISPNFKSGDGIHFGELGNIAIANVIAETVFGTSIETTEGRKQKRLCKLISKKNNLIHHALLKSISDNKKCFPGIRLDKAVARIEKKISRTLFKIQE